MLIAFGLVTYGFTQVGRFLTKEDSLQKADAIAVLAGTSMNRPLEAADLYKEGYASRIVLTHEMPEASYEALAARGVTVPAEADEQREILVRLGVPANAIVLPLRIHDNTAQEAQTLRELAVKNRWRRIIVERREIPFETSGFCNSPGDGRNWRRGRDARNAL